MLASRLCQLVLAPVRERWCQGETGSGNDVMSANG
jgi:hypothetical protein